MKKLRLTRSSLFFGIASLTVLVAIGIAYWGLRGSIYQAVSPANPEIKGGGVTGQSTNIIRVSPNGNDANNGSSWDQAKKNVVNAVFSASGPTDIWLKEGTYPESVTIQSKNDLNLYGGFVGTENSLTERDSDPTKHHPILDGTNTVRPLQIRESTNNIIDRLTIINGNINWHGGALYLYYVTNADIIDSVFQNSATTTAGNGGCLAATQGSLTLTNDIFRNCASAAAGGGLYEVGTALNATNLLIENNRAVKGGGVGLRSGDGLISGSTIRNNVATSTTTEGGGGIYMYGNQRLHILGNTITANQANYGAALDCFYYSTPSIANNIITKNVAGTAAIVAHGYATATTFTNNTISDNHSTVGVSGLSVFDQGSAILLNELYTYNFGPKAAIGRDAGTGFNIGASSAWANTNGTFDNAADADNFKWSMWEEDPMYLNRVYLSDPVSFQLTPNSPGRDYGLVNNLVSDFAGALRPINSRGWTKSYLDKGAYEYQLDKATPNQTITTATLDGYKGSDGLGSQENRKVHVVVKDTSGAVVADNTVPMSKTGFFTMRGKGNDTDPLFNLANPIKKGQGPYTLIISANGYLTKKVSNFTFSGDNFPGVTASLIGGDGNGNNIVDVPDLNQIFIDFTLTGDQECQANRCPDIDGDGTVGVTDLNKVFVNWTAVGE